jgi:hypothetical protein
MDTTKSAIERAFELARSGQASSLAELRAMIKAEGYSLHQITGPSLGRQLRNLITKARAPTGAE